MLNPAWSHALAVIRSSNTDLSIDYIRSFEASEGTYQRVQASLDQLRTDVQAALGDDVELVVQGSFLSRTMLFTSVDLDVDLVIDNQAFQELTNNPASDLDAADWTTIVQALSPVLEPQLGVPENAGEVTRSLAYNVGGVDVDFFPKRRLANGTIVGLLGSGPNAWLPGPQGATPAQLGELGRFAILWLKWWKTLFQVRLPSFFFVLAVTHDQFQVDEHSDHSLMAQRMLSIIDYLLEACWGDPSSGFVAGTNWFRLNLPPVATQNALHILRAQLNVSEADIRAIAHGLHASGATGDANHNWYAALSQLGV